MDRGIANAESRKALAELADEQAALRRVATMVAQGASPQDLFEAVAEEVGRLLPVGSATMGRFEPDDSVTTMASWSTTEAAFPTGGRWPTKGTNVAWIVLQTGRSARIDDFSAATDPIGVTAREAGIKSAVGSPIVVKGRLWGVITATSTEGPMPPDTEGRLASFTELVATAIANAESRAELDVHVEQQAALRRVATLVAEDVPPGEIISAVAEEIGRIAPTEAVHIYRFEPDGTAVRVAAWSELHETLPLGERIPAGGFNLAAMVWETGRAARLDDVSDVTGAATEIVQRLDLRAAVASPIVVEGRLWGVVTGATSKPEPMPADTEDRIADFTELVATAIANAESRAQLDVHAAQQAALRRVATLVAEDVPPSELFEAVAREVGTLLGGDFSGLARFEGNAVFTVGVWAADGEHPPVAPRWEMQPGDPATRIAETRAPLRWDDWTGAPGPIAEFIRELGIRCTVGTPIVVEGRLWGALALHSKQAAPLPPDTEPRMAQFTDLVATAIANRETRAEVTRLADEQAALRRVATLVVRGVPPDEIFMTAAMELRRLFGADIATVGRFEEDRSIAILVGQAQAADAPPLKTRWEVAPPLATAEVARTGRPARMDGYEISTASGETAEAMRRMGVRSAVASPIIVEGDLWGVITVSTNTEPLPPGVEERVTDFTDLVATAISNAKSRSELEASRARVVAASAEERRRVVRDLHDGAQQRLVHAVISLKLALRELHSGDPHAEDYVNEALDHAEQANSELRELVHGILPGVLTSGGLRAGVEELASRASLPVAVEVSADRFAPAVEATAYFVVSEALTNAVKHAGAQGAQVAAHLDNGALYVEIRDDGVGGADPGLGSGLTGLRDRVEALGGTIEIDSPAGRGTSLVAEIPVAGG